MSPDWLADRLEPRPTSESTVTHHGVIWDVRLDTVDLGDAGTVRREFVDHTGAVAVVALDDHDQLVMIQQYRHPVGGYLWEIPAGLLDVRGEPPLDAARRELAEEVDLAADTWHTLTGYYSSPGGNSETLRVFLARDLHLVPEGERHVREHEEAGMPTRWVSLDAAHRAVLAGRISSPAAMIGILTAHAARATDWTTLRAADAPWPEHPAYRG